MFCDKLTEKAIVLSDNPLAKTKNGNIAGIKKSSTYIFRGIKYANAERFHMPSKVGHGKIQNRQYHMNMYVLKELLL